MPITIDGLSELSEMLTQESVRTAKIDYSTVLSRLSERKGYSI